MKVSKGISSISIILSILSLLSLLAVNPWIISKFFGQLHPYHIENIRTSQWMIFGLAFFLGLIGVLGLKKGLFNYVAANPRKGNLTLLLICFFSLIWFTESLLHIKPLLTTQQLYDASIPYENAQFSRTRLPQKSIKIKYSQMLDKTNYELNQGYHGPKFSYKKPTDEIRIVILGGSFIFGDQSELSWENIEAEYDRNWILKIQEKLRKRGYQNLRIINAGIPGHTSFDSFGRLYSEVHLLKPDYVVFCHGWNDIELFADIKPSNSLLRLMNPKQIKTREEVSDIFEYSQLYLRIKRLFQFEGLGVEGIKHQPEPDLEVSSFAVNQFKLNLNLFIHTCHLIGAKPIIMTQPRLIHSKNTQEQRNRILYPFQRLGHSGICESYELIDSLILNSSIEDSSVISYDFAKPYIGIDSLFVDHVHLNSIGGEVMSDDLANFFETILTNKN